MDLVQVFLTWLLLIVTALLVRAFGWPGLFVTPLYLIAGAHTGVVLSRKRGVPEPDIRLLVVYFWPLVVVWCAVEKIRGFE